MREEESKKTYRGEIRVRTKYEKLGNRTRNVKVINRNSVNAGVAYGTVAPKRAIVITEFTQKGSIACIQKTLVRSNQYCGCGGGGGIAGDIWGTCPGGNPNPGGGGGAKPPYAGILGGGCIMGIGAMPGGAIGICIGGMMVCWGVKPGGGGGWARIPANWPWYGAWKPGIGAPKVIGAGGGRAATGRALFLRA